MLLLTLAVWLIARPYAGISQDALLYSFQAFSRLHPKSLGGDVFLAGLSQDSFTVFPRLHAIAIGWWGLEPAAVILTLAGQLWWFAAAWFVARSLVGRQWALLSLALVAAYPGYYGAYEVFRYAEPFITSRLYSEALVLTSLALALRGKLAVALLASLVAMTFHPLMGIVGLLVVATQALGRRGILLMTVSILTGLLVTIGVSRLSPVLSIDVLDPQWFDLARSRSPFLVVQDWNADTWAALLRAQVLAWLAVTAFPAGSKRQFLVTVAVAGLLGLAITVIGASLGHVVLLTQGQGWRWMWLVQAVAILASPLAVRTHWSAGPLPRSSLLLFLSGVLLSGWPSVVMSGLSLAILWLTWDNEASARRWVLLPAWVAASLSAVAYVTTASSSVVGLLQDGLLPLALVVVCWTMLGNARLRLLAAVPVLGMVVLAFSQSGGTWTTDLSGRSKAWQAFEPWRDAIPLEAEVYWPQHVDVVWFSLHRRSFMSHLQTAGALFSREVTLEMLRRTGYTRPALPAAIAFGDGAAGRALGLTRSGIVNLCRPGGADYVITTEAFGLPEAAAPVISALGTNAPQRQFRLLACSTVRENVSSGRTPGNPT